MKKSRIFAVLMTAALAATSMGAATAFAGDTAPAETTTSAAPKNQAKTEKHDVTIVKNATDTKAHKYQAYQIFKGAIADDVMVDIEWGDNVDSAALKTALSADDVDGVVKTAFAEFFKATDPTAFTPSNVAKAISNNAGKTGFPQKLADVLNSALKGDTPAGSVEIADGETEGVIEDLTTGYYLIKDEDGSQADKESVAYTDFILRVVDDVEVDVKEDVPSISKNIQEGNTKTKGTNAAIGDVINYTLDSHVPNMEGYEKYFFIVSDKMCDGLTFDSDSVAITIGGETLDRDTDFYVKTADGTGKEKLTAEGKTFEIVFVDFIQYADNAADKKDIVINYSATLNENADRTLVGNPNEVDLTFSNNPNEKSTGQPNVPDEPDDDDPMGITPKDKTRVFTTGIRVLKVDENDLSLQGAEFTLTGANLNTVLTYKSTGFVADEAGKYWLLKNGTYTTTAPVAGKTDDKYESTTTKYKLGAFDYSAFEKSGDTAEVTAEVDKSGYLTFAGLKAGTYTLTETKAPNGYNAVQPIEFEITADIDMTKAVGEQITWKVDGKVVAGFDGEEVKAIADDEYSTIHTVKVVNKRGIILPVTGGVGTVLFYIIGSLLTAGAVVLFVNRRKAAKTK